LPTRPTKTARFAVALVGALALSGLCAPLARAEPRAAASAVDPPGRTLGVAAGSVRPAAKTLATPGYWLLASDGGVYQFGTVYDGSTRGLALSQPIVGMTPTADGAGYWLVASDGGVFSFGDATFFGSTGGVRLNRPIVGMAATPSGRGYWMVASDGGVFAFGDAAFFGSTGGVRLNRPIVGMAATPDGRGYWMVASDGGVFAFGDARFFGSTGAVALVQPIVGMAANPFGGGYWLVAADGGLFSFGAAPFFGSAASQARPFPIIAMAATKLGFPYPQGGMGFDISWPQCGPPAHLPPSSLVTVVGVNDGTSHNTAGTDITRNPCLGAEAAWAGQGLTVYINVEGVRPGDLPAAAKGPAGTCAVSDLVCQGYNWGWDVAVRSVAFAHAQGIFPTVWWLDVEGPCGFATVLWRCDSLASNAQVIQGALDGLHANSLIAGIYSTFLQFPLIAGATYSPGVPLWIADAPTSVAAWVADCTTASKRFGGGQPWLVQWLGSSSPTGFDEDYACPQG
jgi:hypothetical protein